MQKNPLLQFAGIPVSTAELRSCFTDFASPEKKIQSLEKNGELIRLKRGLFVVNPELTNKNNDARLCANHLYGPSYVSLQWALRYYGMIPEQVFMMTSVTTKRSRTFDTPLGRFSYMQVPASYFAVGVEIVENDNVAFLMASREKALCDTILYDNFVPNKSLKALYAYLEEDMRLDMDILHQLNAEIIDECAKFCRKSAIFNNLIKIVQQ